MPFPSPHFSLWFGCFSHSGKGICWSPQMQRSTGVLYLILQRGKFLQDYMLWSTTTPTKILSFSAIGFPCKIENAGCSPLKLRRVGFRVDGKIISSLSPPPPPPITEITGEIDHNYCGFISRATKPRFFCSCPNLWNAYLAEMRGLTSGSTNICKREKLILNYWSFKPFFLIFCFYYLYFYFGFMLLYTANKLW